MAGSSVTFTRLHVGDMTRVKIAWVSDDAAGTASGASTFAVRGIPVRFTTVPSGGGTAPTDNYDITITDDLSVDILAGLGADRDTANTETRLQADGLIPVFSETITFSVANAGNSKQGTAYLYLVNMWPDLP